MVKNDANDISIFNFYIFRIVSKSECWRCLVTKEDREEDNVDLRVDPGKILKILIKKYKSVISYNFRKDIFT